MMMGVVTAVGVGLWLWLVLLLVHGQVREEQRVLAVVDDALVQLLMASDNVVAVEAVPRVHHNCTGGE